MESKISIMAFPQKQVGNSLFLNVLAVVRNYNPLTKDDLSTAWVDSTLRLHAMVIDSPDEYPRLNLPATTYDLPGVKMSPQAKNIFTSLKSRFKITKTANSVKGGANKTKIETVKKYLPFTYRESFNFTTPRDKNSGVINDEYHCAIKGNPDPDPNFAAAITDETSWGKVFAFCLRHKVLAKKCGFIHENLEIKLPDNTFKNGGWLYVDIHPDCSYYADVQADKNYVKRYAARIPKLDFTKNRSLFAAVEFPVLLNENAPAADEPLQPSEVILDQIFIEAAEYSDGFCKIVHNYQPLSNSLIREDQDEESPVTNDIGIRLGWDDEQLAIWHSRQMGADPATGKRADAPLGVFQYRIDARETAEDPNNPANWISLCKVKYDKDVFLDAEKIGNNNDELEMGVEVYPSKPDAAPDTHFWLPAYFSQWIGNSLALQDEDAIAIYHKDQIDKNHLSPANIYDPPGEQPFKGVKNDYYKPVGLEKISLLYSHQYDFRVRMSDITGGGPAEEDQPQFDAPSPITSCLFKRHVIPQTLNFVTPLPQSDTAFFEEKKVSLKRPLLGYPSVLFTGAYPDCVKKLIADADAVIAGNLKRDVGLPDPDVNRVEITVEVKCLALDATIRKLHQKDNFAWLYTTTRNFKDALDSQMDLNLSFIDASNLIFFAGQELPDMGLHLAGETNIDKRADIVLPTARDLRITVRPVTISKPDYYGGTTTGDKNGPNRTELKGMRSVFMTRSAAKSEKNLIKATGENMMIRGVYLQPEEPIKVTADFKKLLVENLSDTNQTPSIMDRLSAAVGTDSKGMSLTGRPGQRWQFGVSRSIRHTAAPDNTSITFATKNDLLNHWIIPITLLTDRDWSWDGVKPISINIYRRKIFVRDAMQLMGSTNKEDFLSNDNETIFSNAAIKAGVKEELVGDIEFKQAINITALTGADRSQTYTAFMDAVEPKQNDEKKFPDELLLAYRISVNFNEDADNPEPAKDDDLNLYLHLPITTPPAQMPKIVSAGMAFSKYVRDENYANTENRKKYLWVEFAEPIENPDDAYFARMLAYSPDVLLARWETELLIAQKEPPLPLDLEFIRIISPASSDDKTGYYAMQQMIPASDSNVHFLVPLPPGIHAEALEMFGFFTYEFRVGHKLPWTTAHGRFGRALRHTGIQFPPPQLFCVPNRNEKYITVAAPYAQTVFDGRNITANPPRTELGALLYAQVRMADDSDTRNILISDRKLRLIPQKLAKDESPINSDATPQGIAGWRNKEVEDILGVYGLPLDSPLSVLCVEMMPGYDNFLVNQQRNQGLTNLTYSNGDNALFLRSSPIEFNTIKQYMSMANEGMKEVKQQINANFQKDASPANDVYAAASGIYDDGGPRPLTSDLGTGRILRTSTLIAVPEVCCTV